MRGGNLRLRPERYALSHDSRRMCHHSRDSRGTQEGCKCATSHSRTAASPHTCLQPPSGPCTLPCGAPNILLRVWHAPVLALPYLTLGTLSCTCHHGCPAAGKETPAALGAGLRDKSPLRVTQPGLYYRLEWRVGDRAESSPQRTVWILLAFTSQVGILGARPWKQDLQRLGLMWGLRFEATQGGS